MKHTIILLVASLVPGLLSTIAWAEHPPEAKADQIQLQTLLRDLESSEFTVREAAERELIQRGAEAVEALNEALQSDSPERRVRARRVLEAISIQLRHTRFTSFRGPRITRENAKDLSLVGELDEYVRRMPWSPDESRVAFVGWEGPVGIRDATSLRALDEFTTKRGIVHFAFGPKPGIVAFCENGGVATIVNRRTGKTTPLATGPGQHQLTFSPDGSLLATGGYGTEAKLWRVADGNLVASLDVGAKAGGLSPVFAPDGKRLAVGNRNSTTTIFEVPSGKPLQVLPRKMTQEIAFSPDGKSLATTYVDGTLGLWDHSTGKPRVIKPTSAEELYSVAWSPTGELLATSGRQAKITLWNPEDLSIVRELEAPEWVIRVGFTPDGTRLLASGGASGHANRNTRQVMMWGVPGAGVE